MRPQPSGLFGKVEFPVLLAALIIAGGLWGFVELMEVARDTTPHAFDTEILLAFRARRATRRSDRAALAGRCDARHHQPRQRSRAGAHHRGHDHLSAGDPQAAGPALFVFVAVAGGQVLSQPAEARRRPAAARTSCSHLVEVHTLSFPSGHAMLSAVTYLTLGALLARFLPGRATKIYVLSLAVLTTVLVGVSRIYLGVHWPSDVLAGWCAGFAWAMLCWLVARWVLRRGRATARRCMLQTFILMLETS